MARYDIENYIDDFITKLKNELNTKISAINSDKGDSLLSTVDNAAYIYKKTSTKVKAYSPFVYYEPYEDVTFDDEQELRGLVHPAKTYGFEIGIGFRNNNRYADDDEDNFKRVMRYQKAFEEALIEVNNKLQGYGYLELIDIKSGNEEREENTLLHVSGFTVNVTLGG